MEPRYVEAQGPPQSTGVSYRIQERWTIGILEFSDFFYNAPFLREKAYDVCCKKIEDFSQNALFISLQYYYIQALVGSRWNPVRMKRPEPFFPPRYHLLGLVKQF